MCVFGYYVCIEFTTDTGYFSQLVQRGKSCLVSICVLSSLEIWLFFYKQPNGASCVWSRCVSRVHYRYFFLAISSNRAGCVCLVSMCFLSLLQILVIFPQLVQRWSWNWAALNLAIRPLVWTKFFLFEFEFVDL